MRFVLSLFAFALFAVAAPVDAEASSQLEQDRRNMVAAHDRNDNGQLRGGQMKRFREAHPRAYSSLMDFCSSAVHAPSEHGVRFQGKKKPQRYKCRHNRADAPYIDAWIRSAAEMQPRREDRSRTRQPAQRQQRR